MDPSDVGVWSHMEILETPQGGDITWGWGKRRKALTRVGGSGLFSALPLAKGRSSKEEAAADRGSALSMLKQSPCSCGDCRSPNDMLVPVKFLLKRSVKTCSPLHPASMQAGSGTSCWFPRVCKEMPSHYLQHRNVPTLVGGHLPDRAAGVVWTAIFCLLHPMCNLPHELAARSCGWINIY